MQIKRLRRTILLLSCMGAAALLICTLGVIRGASAGVKISQVSAALQDSPTPTFCPKATPERLPLVDPLVSPTDLITQTVVVYHSRSDAITVTGESGVFSLHAGDAGWAQPALVDVRLLRNTLHHLTVTSRVPEFTIGGCYYHSYSLHTQFDSNGEPLVIEQMTPFMQFKFFLPFFLRG